MKRWWTGSGYHSTFNTYHLWLYSSSLLIVFVILSLSLSLDTHPLDTRGETIQLLDLFHPLYSLLSTIFSIVQTLDSSPYVKRHENLEFPLMQDNYEN